MMKRLLIIVMVILAICCAISYPACRGRFISWKLVRAVQHNNVALVRSLLDKGISANTKSSEGMPLLLLAVANGNKETVNLLLDEGADINIKQDAQAFSFNHPFSKGTVSVSYGPITSLQLAVLKGDTELTQLLLDRGADADIQVDVVTFSTINPLNRQSVSMTIGGTALHFALALRYCDLIDILLPKTTNVNTVSADTTPLNLAILLRKIDIVKALLEKGAEVNPKGNDSYMTPLKLAVTWSSDDNCPDPEIAKQLLIFGANVDGKIRDDEATPLQMACVNRCPELVKLLLEYGANVNMKTQYGASLLHGTAYFGQTDIVKMLIDYGVDVNIKDQKGQTALDKAIYKGYADIAELIRMHGGKKGAELGEPGQ